MIPQKEKQLKKAIEKLKQNISPKKFDGNNLNSACQHYEIRADNWAEIIRFENGYLRAINDVLEIIKYNNITI